MEEHRLKSNAALNRLVSLGELFSPLRSWFPDQQTGNKHLRVLGVGGMRCEQAVFGTPA